MESSVDPDDSDSGSDEEGGQSVPHPLDGEVRRER